MMQDLEDQGIESKNTGDATNKQLEDADGWKESVSNSFSESSSDQSSPSKTLHIQNVSSKQLFLKVFRVSLL